MPPFEIKSPALKSSTALANAVIDGLIGGTIDPKLANMANKAVGNAIKATNDDLRARLSRNPEAVTKTAAKLAKEVETVKAVEAEIKFRKPDATPKPEVRKIDVDVIYPSFHARPIDAAAVHELSASMREVGLMNPISVRAVTRHRNGAPYEAFEIVAGHHRHAGAKLLGWPTVQCTVVVMDDLHAELAELDENLVRLQLSPAQEASAISRRKAIYEALHPETKHGGDRKSDQVDKLATRSGRFTAATAEATGKSERDVRRAAARGEALGDDLKAVEGTSLDKGVELDALAKMSAEEREPLIDRAKAGEKVSARNVASGVKSARGEATPVVTPYTVPVDGELLAPRRHQKFVKAGLDGSTIVKRLGEIERLWSNLAPPDLTARHVGALQTAISSRRIAEIGQWFLALARELDKSAE